jgi:hypothetical protein
MSAVSPPGKPLGYRDTLVWGARGGLGGRAVLVALRIEST